MNLDNFKFVKDLAYDPHFILPESDMLALVCSTVENEYFALGEIALQKWCDIIDDNNIYAIVKLTNKDLVNLAEGYDFRHDDHVTMLYNIELNSSLIMLEDSNLDLQVVSYKEFSQYAVCP